MPRVKVDYVVSFSSEDPDNQASNLLASEVSKKKWLCAKGEPSCSVVLQLTKAVKISAVHIGAHHAALVEVLVGLSEKPNDQFQVLVPSSVFLTPMESRRDDNVSRVRSFSAEQLSSDARDKRWDRVRLVCSQPYNKHCKYGLSFIHIFEAEGKEIDTPALPVPKRLLSLDTMSSDEEEFRPGELFAKHMKPSGHNSNTSTDAQIRKATSHALKNIPDSSTKLTKTPIDRENKDKQNPHSSNDDIGANRKRTSLMYTDDDEQPNAKIDRIVNRHNDEKEKQVKKDKQEKKDDKKDDKRPARKDDDKQEKKDDKKDDKRPARKDDGKHRDDSNKNNSKTPQKRDGGSKDRDRDARKRQHSDEKASKKTGLRAGPVTDSPETLLSDVVFVLSGYENPRRAAVRDAALCMGATMQRDWGPTCTHLICAFPNTPKLKAVRSSRQADTAVVVTAEWVERCCSTRRRLPWQWFATEPSRRVPFTDADLQDAPDSDTDEEKPQRNVKKQRTDSPDAKPRGDKQRTHSNRSLTPPRRNDNANVSTDSDVAFVKDERIQGNVTIADSDSDATDEELPTGARCVIEEAASLPDFFDGFTFAIDSGTDATFRKNLLQRYLLAYGGVLVEESQIDEDMGVDYVLCARAPVANVKGKAVRADWVWKCHEEKQLWPITDYVLS